MAAFNSRPKPEQRPQCRRCRLTPANEIKPFAYIAGIRRKAAISQRVQRPVHLTWTTSAQPKQPSQGACPVLA